MRTLRLFNCVLAKVSGFKYEITPEGLIIDGPAMWARNEIVAYYSSKKLSAKELNETPFYKSFATVRAMSRYEILLDQIAHYASTYGTGFTGKVFIPAQVVELPEDREPLEFRYVRGVTRDELVKKCLQILQSGIALAQNDIEDILHILIVDLGYIVTEHDGIKNKEAIVVLADKYNVMPFTPLETLRLAIFKSTTKTLLIKNPATIAAIKISKYNPAKLFTAVGFKRMAEIFNRFKPLFLAYKKHCPAAINAISKLSKTHHKPMPQNAVNLVTDSRTTVSDANMHWFKNATPFAFFKALNALRTRIAGQTNFCYRIRNGKSWTKEVAANANIANMQHNYDKMMEIARTRWDMTGKTVYVPAGITYGVPTSAKMFTGNVPTGTTFECPNLIIGIYWRNDWGARDIDLSAINISGDKIGWNAMYHNRELTYSGDITNAPDGASEYLSCVQKLRNDYLIQANTFYGGMEDVKFTLIIGHGDPIARGHIIDPANIIFQETISTAQRQTVLGLLLDNKFVIGNFASGASHVSSADPKKIKAMVSQVQNSISFNELLIELGATMVATPEEAIVDLSLSKLDKDTFIQLLSEKENK
jgi:hypothetical protein